MTEKVKLPSVVLVHWRDAAINSGYDQHGLVDMHTVGFLVHESEEYITVALDMQPDHDCWRNSSSIPRVNIISILQMRLGRVKENIFKKD
jgi:hypothetical protein